MRTIKELLQIMLDNPQHFEHGLCMWAINLCEEGLITGKERKLLKDYIKVNEPFIFSSFDVFKEKVIDQSYYYWGIGKIEPRIEWLKKHINKN